MTPARADLEDSGIRADGDVAAILVSQFDSSIVTELQAAQLAACRRSGLSFHDQLCSLKEHAHATLIFQLEIRASTNPPSSLKH
jgi:hypothetical protein